MWGWLNFTPLGKVSLTLVKEDKNLKKILKIMVAVFIISFVLFNREVRAENLQIKQGVLDLQEQPLNDQVLKLEGE